MTAEIPLRARDGSIRAVAIVDVADVPLVNQWRWHFDGRYAVRHVRPDGDRSPTKIYLHRFLLSLAPGDLREGDHIDLDKLNCRRRNLRVLEPGCNQQNVAPVGGTSDHRGVTWDKANRKWKAQARLAGRKHAIGYFTDPDEAGRAAAAFRAEHMPYSHADQQEVHP